MYTSCGQRLLQVGNDAVLGQGGACVSLGSSDLSIELGMGLINVMVSRLPLATLMMRTARLWGVHLHQQGSVNYLRPKGCSSCQAALFLTPEQCGSLLAADLHCLGSIAIPRMTDIRLCMQFCW